MDDEKCAVCGNMMSECTCPKPEAPSQTETPAQ